MLVVFISVLYLNRSEKKRRRTEVPEPIIEGGTAFELEGDKVVRRSTR